HDTALAAAVAVGAAIATMMALRCLHPPGGACALFAAVGASVVHDQGFAFAVFPVAINSVFLLVIAIAVNNLTGRRYPHVAEVPAAGKLGLRTADIEEAIARLDQGLDILPADVVALMRNAEAHALDRQLGRLEVRSLMTADVVTVQPFESVYRVRLIMTQNRVKAVPVIDPQRRVLGIVTIYDLFFLGMASVAAAETVMTAPVTTIRADAPLSRLVAVMTEQELRHLPVVDGEDKLVGIVSRTELITVLNRALLNAGGLGAATAD
ncbi:MAG: CBS domain-containing protein, partial [Jatrophihabitans sp.]